MRHGILPRRAMTTVLATGGKHATAARVPELSCVPFAMFTERSDAGPVRVSVGKVAVHAKQPDPSIAVHAELQAVSTALAP